MDLVLTPDNPPPPGARAVTLHSTRGVELRAMVAIPKAARGTVLVVGGRGDYLERYFETMRDFAARGFATANFDLRGQGGSTRLTRNPLRGHIDSFADYDDDLETMMTQLVLPLCPQPIHVIGHSTGAAVVLRSLAAQAWFARAVLISPLLGLNYGKWPKPVVTGLLRLYTSLGLSRAFLIGQRHTPMGLADFPGNPLTSDPRRWARDSAVLAAAPQLGIGGATFGWLKAARAAMAGFEHFGPRTTLTAPVMIVAAGRDRVVSNDAIQRFVRRVPGIASLTIAESLHEILSERDSIRDQFFAVFDSFIDG